MDQMEFDKTRKAIKVDKLADTDRRNLLDKFHSAGGEILRENSLAKPPSSPSDEKRKKSDSGSGRGGEIKLPSEQAREKNRKEQEIAAKLRRLKEQQEREATGFLALFMIRLRCKLKGLTSFSGEYVEPRFMSTLNLDMKRSVMECHLLANELFALNKKVCDAVIKDLDEKNPLYVELLERASYLYDRSVLTELTRSYMDNPDTPVRLDSIRIPLLTILRKIYYLKPFQETYIKAAEFAIDAEEKIEKKQSALYTTKKKKIRSDWNNLMNDVFPSLVLLAQCSEMMRAEPYTEIFENMIGVVLSERPGQRKSGELPGSIASEREESKEAEAEDKEERIEGESAEKNEEISDTFEVADAEEDADSPEMKYGNLLLRLRRLDRMRSELDPRNEWSYLAKSDKMLITYLLLNVFEKDFSFVLTTSKIKINSYQRSDSKIDIRRKMSGILDSAHFCQDAFRKYLLEAQEYYRVSTEEHSSSNYVEQAKRLSSIDGRRGATGREFKKSVMNLMIQVRDVLKILIEDMKGPSLIVDNADEAMVFDLPAETSKRLNKRPVKQCVWEAFSFASALSAQLESGLLYGGVIEVPAENYAGFFEKEPEEPDLMDMPL